MRNLFLLSFLILLNAAFSQNKISFPKQSPTPTSTKPLIKIKEDESKKDNWAVAVVDDRTLYKWQMDKNVDLLLKSAPEKPDSDEYEQRKTFYEERFVYDWTKSTLYAREAISRGLTVSDSEVDNKIKTLLKESGENINLEQRLQQLNITETEFREQMKDAILTDKLVLKEITSRYSDEQLKAVYTANPNYFKTSTQVKVSQIFKKISGEETFSKKKSMKEEIEKIREKASKNPEKFSEYAEEFSDDVLSKKQKGDLGWQDVYNLLPKPVNKTIFKLKVGEISDVIETKYGYHILKVTDRKESTGNTFEEAKPLIIEYLYKAIDEKVYEEYKTSHKIMINTSGIDPERLKKFLSK